MGHRLIQYLAFVVLGVVLGENPSSLLSSGTGAHPAALRHRNDIEGERPWTLRRPHKILERAVEHEVILSINERVTRAAEIPATNDNQHASHDAAYSDAITTQIPDAVTVEKPPTSDESIDESPQSMDLTTPLLMSTESDPIYTETEDGTLSTTTVESTATTFGTVEEEYQSDYQPDSTTSRLDFEDSTMELIETSNLPESSENGSVASNSSARSLGRALSHEDIDWQIKSTKIIGTIIEDIRPYGDNTIVLSLGGIIAISLCIVTLLVSITGVSGYWWYRRRYLNRPETLNERYTPSEGINEDVFRVGYINSPEFPRQDSSEEMYSLDNDSFLTSLEAMTIPTYWTENIKHTKL